MPESNDQKNTATRDKILKVLFIIGTVIFFALFYTYVAAILVGSSDQGIYVGYYHSTSGWFVRYGSEAMKLALNPSKQWFYNLVSANPFITIPFLQMTNGGYAGWYMLTTLAFFYQIPFFLFCILLKKKMKLLIATLIIVCLLIIGVVVADPLSRASRAENVPAPVTEYLSSQYGEAAAGDMKVVIEKEHGGTASKEKEVYYQIESEYTVSSPSLPKDLKLMYIRLQPLNTNEAPIDDLVFEIEENDK